jgi:hypothetical protein
MENGDTFIEKVVSTSSTTAVIYFTVLNASAGLILAACFALPLTAKLVRIISITYCTIIESAERRNVKCPF